MGMWVQSLAFLSGLGSDVAVSCGVGHRCGSDLPFCGCGIGWQLQLLFDPWPRNFHVPWGRPLRDKKNKLIKLVVTKGDRLGVGVQT